MTKRYILYPLVILTLLFIFFEWIGITNFKAQTIHNSVATSGLVTNKEVDENFIYYIYLNKLDEKNKKIVVPSKNLWNLIELERTYFVVYQWDNDETPQLEQIMIDDEFKEIYSDKLTLN